MSSVIDYIQKHRPRFAKLCLTTSHVSLVFISFFFYNFQRSPYQILTAYLGGIAVELILNYSTNRYKDRPFDRILTAASEAAGMLVLIRSLVPNYYLFGTAIAVASKYIFLNKEKRHLFNPTNFAIVMTLAFASNDTIYLAVDEFSYNLYPIFHVVFIGTIATILGRVWIMPLTYILTYVLIALVFQGHGHLGNFVDIIGPELGATGLIFIFLMITDPATAPKTYYGRMAFAFSVVVLTFTMRWHHIAYANYISLFIMYCCYGVLQLLPLNLLRHLRPLKG